MLDKKKEITKQKTSHASAGDRRRWARGQESCGEREVAVSCAVPCCCAGTWQHPVSTLQEGAPSFFLTWPDSFSEEIYTGTERNICHSKPPWSREMRHCEPLSWDLTILRAEEVLFQERAPPWVSLDTPERRVPGLHQDKTYFRIYLAVYRYLELTGLHPCRLLSLPLRSRQRNCHFWGPIHLFLRQTSQTSQMNCAVELLISLSQL